MKQCLRTLVRDLALALAVLIAMSGLCAQASSGWGSGSFVGSSAGAYEFLERGSEGEAVRDLQLRLIELGYLSGKADGDYGAKTEKAVKAFQEAADLEATGEADAETQEVLFGTSAPAAPQSTTKSKQQEKAQESSGSGMMVWIPNSGKKYHSNASCSNMKNPQHVSLEEAERRGFTRCKKCW